MKQNDLTEEQLWLLCEEYEKKLQALREEEQKLKDNYRDKGVDWEYWQLLWSKEKLNH